MICPTRSGTTEIYFFGPADAGIQNKICNLNLKDIVLQLQKYLEMQVFLVLQKYLEYQKQWNCTKLSERDTDMQNREFATYVTDFVFSHGICIFCFKFQTLNDEK